MKEETANYSQERAKKRERQKGDRWDGYKVKNVGAYQRLVPFLMKTRDASSLFFMETYDATNLKKYLDKKNEELKNNPNSPIEKYNYNIFFLAAIIRTFALRPHLNRFVAGKTIYQRHDIEIGYVVKKKLSDDGQPTVTQSAFERDSNIEDVALVLAGDIKEAKDESGDEYNDFLDKFMNLPNFIISFVVWLINFSIKIGHVPKVFRSLDAMQASAFISNLGSVGLDNVPIHHLYDRGTISVFATIGQVQKGYLPTADGVVEKDLVDITITLDERVTEGLYFINSLKVLRDIILNPEQLDERLKEVPIDE